MKKNLLLLAVLALGFSQLKAEDKITIDEFTAVAAGETVEVNVNLENPDRAYGGLQFDLYLPEGVNIATTPSNALWCKASTRLKYEDDFGDTQTLTNEVTQQADGSYRFLVYNMAGKSISGSTGPVFTIRIQATDAVSTTGNQVKIKNQVLSTVDAVQYTPADKEDYPCTLTINAKIGKGGYGTFSWPVALDFSGSGIEVYVGTDYANGWLQLEPLTDGKVPANTGVLLKGEANATVNPQTTTESVATPAQNQLLNTAAETVTSDGSIYALATKTAGTGLYRVNDGVVVPKYKAYLQLPQTDAREAVFFGDGDSEATGISLKAPSDSPMGEREVWYDLQGRKINVNVNVNVNDNGQLAKGIYIINGKKTVVK